MRFVTSLIPVLVTGIQPRRVRAVNDSVRGESSTPKDLGALDSCDIPRAKPEEANEGVAKEARASTPELTARAHRVLSKLRPCLRVAAYAALAGAPVAFASGFDLPTKRTDLPETDLKRVADVTRPTSDFSKAEQYEAMQAGGATSIDPVTEDSFSHISANIPFEEEQNFKLGNALFRKLWVSSPSSTQASDGLGPLFNARSCMSCHVNDGRGKPPEGGPSAVSMFLRLSRAAATPEEEKAIAGADILNFPDPVYGHQLQDLAVPGLAAEGRMTIRYDEETATLGDGETVSLRRPHYAATNLAYGPLDAATTISARVAPAMIGLGLIEAIPEADILAHADPDDADGDGISGKAAIVRDHRSGEIALGRFGWKAQNATVRDQNADAFANDIGISTPDHPDAHGDCTKAEEKCLDLPTGVQKRLGAEEAPGPILDLVTFYSENLAVPARRKASFPETLKGKRIFYESGCISCHVPKFVTRRDSADKAQSFQLIWPYSDFLLHDMGDGLADGQQVGLASGREWRTPPLWGIGLTRTVSGHSFFLHDGRARDLTEAILWHGGEADKARNAFSSLSKDDRAALITFLESL
ncbi:MULTISPECIES: di-heme oxidoredictase family protein [Rhizobium]|uniref:di-heme oxidoreductase family protein n=1 Tax=Rhizobium TaxID=379 RepID=UPI0015CF7F55|nr:MULTISPECIES: di-heme oxidoredictase family protein [Rhizobium]MBY4588363.1 c-type cytochrome [Rhizobium redzepovicii]MBY4614563.1 c-type cytochrome [Rhizobium redzepovicii]MDF0660192.1 di-heme oxidoredictase family protein [Rhizobium sp. BC49]MDR9780105.1 di-heme oxidoredictase family protein [Rhizobium redzepovicii]ULJ77801.1 c-type cytochrome [Rhizobium sp. C104]